MSLSWVMQPLLGGMLIGAASVIVLKTHGRVVGVSGIVGSLLRPKAGDIGWRVAFGVGLVLAGVVANILSPQSMSVAGAPGLVAVVSAGLLVGFGTRLGNGCTSGHGVCGVSRMSPRSLAATAVFVLTGMATVFVVRHLIGGAN